MNLSDLYEVSPYLDFPVEDYELKLNGWNSNSPVFMDLIAKHKPKLIIEVGTWMGASAIHMAALCDELELKDTKIVCVDTFLGSLEFWTDKEDAGRYKSLNIVHGFPQVYYQFLANVLLTGHEERIIPFPQTSRIAGMWFEKNKVRPDMVYLDASHDYQEVSDDIHQYKSILKERGVLFGDDILWHGVKKALCVSGLDHEAIGEKWILKYD